MYRKHAHFSISWVVTAIIIILAGAFLAHGIATRLNRQTPSVVVKQYLDQIRENPQQLADAYLLSLADNSSDSLTAGEAASFLFEHFSYNILNEKTDHDRAAVDVSITNIDMKPLARDLCEQMTLRAASPYLASSPLPDTDEYYRMLVSTLSSHTYPLSDTTAQFHLTKINHVWVIEADDTLSDCLVSHFPDYMKDPDTLPPEDVLDIYLQEFTKMSAEDWVAYLRLNDVFSTGSPGYAKELDLLYASKIAEYISFEIGECRRDGTNASVNVSVGSLDMEKVLSLYREKLLKYAKSAESITSDSAALSDAAALYLMEALQDCTDSAVRDIQVNVTYDGYTWHPRITEELTDAFLGNLENALLSFNDEPI